MVDVKTLRNRIDMSGIKITHVAKKSGMLRATLYRKLQGKSEFTATEILAISDVLGFTAKERENIFFAKGLNEMTLH